MTSHEPTVSTQMSGSERRALNCFVLLIMGMSVMSRSGMKRAGRPRPCLKGRGILPSLVTKSVTDPSQSESSDDVSETLSFMVVRDSSGVDF